MLGLLHSTPSGPREPANPPQVDDNQVIRLMLSRGLTALGYAVVTAASGEECCDFLCDCGVLPDVLLLDAYYSPTALTGFEARAASGLRVRGLPGSGPLV